MTPEAAFLKAMWIALALTAIGFGILLWALVKA